MIKPVTYYAATCDNCKEDWMNDYHGWAAMNDDASLKDMLQNDGWHIAEDGKTYCTKCHSIDDDDNLILKQQ